MSDDEAKAGRTWYVLHVKPRTEKRVDEFLSSLRVFHYLPLVRKETRVQRRKVVRFLPVFPGYVFTRLLPEERLRVLRTQQVVRTIVVTNPRRMIHQLRQVEHAGRLQADLRPAESFAAGECVKVVSGPLRGVEGCVKRVGNVTSIVLTVDILGQALEATVDPRDIEKIGERPSVKVKKSVEWRNVCADVLVRGLAALVCLASLGCSRTEDGVSIRTAADLKGRHVAHMSSDFHKKELKALQPDIVFDPYSEFSFAIESLRGRKIDAISLGRTYADIWMAKFPGEFRVAFDYADDVIAFLLPKNAPLKPKVDAELRKMNAAGETAAIARKWTEGAKAGKDPSLPEFPAPPAGAQEIRVACAAQIEPWCFVSDGRASGAEIEILSVIADRLGMRLKPKIFSWGGMVDCVNAGRCEIANGGIYTNGEAFPTVDASEKYADEKMCILVRNEAFAGGASGLVAFAKSLKASFIRTFVTEARWKMLADGFGVTLFITFLSVIFATVLAFFVWRARSASNAFVSACAKGYIAFMQGTPLLVFLMVLFYVVFGRVDIAGIWVAVIGFSLNASAYLGEVLRSGIESVPRGQTEAALALGYTPRRAFFRIVLPQAVRTVLPVYRGQVVILLKNTSIVGYIAIGDLTKASDLVRSRTYESFFPIITTALIYFAASWLLAFALERFGRRLDPAFGRKRKGGAA